ncbi:MAG TPA: restriction endonuclease [Lysobacter sp.]
MGLKPVTRRHDDSLSRVGWEQFEALLAAYYRSQGYEVEQVGTGATGHKFDGGVDLKLRRDDSHILVQCKRWTAMKVPHNAVHELLGIMVNQGATGAILITSGEFTKAAIEAAARQRNFTLIDGHELRAMLGPVPESALLARARLRDPVTKLASTAVSDLSRAVVAKLIVVGLFLIVVLLVGQYLQGAVRSLPTAVASPPIPVEKESGRSAPVTVPSVQVVTDSCHEVIDEPSRTYIDHCSSGKTTGHLSPAQLREKQREADEAMKVIAETTPEL